MKKAISALKRIVTQLMGVLDLRQRRRLFIVYIAMLFSSSLELLGVSAIYPFLQFMVSPNELKGKWYSNWIYYIFPEAGQGDVLIIFCIAFTLIFLLKNSLSIFFSYLQHNFAARFEEEASINMLRYYMQRPYEFFVNTNSSIIIRGIGRDVSSVYEIIVAIFQASGEMLTIAILVVYLGLLDIKMTVGALFLASICFVVIIKGFKGKINQAGRMARDASAGKVMRIYQAVNGIKEITVLDRKESFIEEYGKEVAIARKAVVMNGVISACPERIIEGVYLSGFIVIACVRFMTVDDPKVFISILGSFAMGAFKIVPSVSKLITKIYTILYHQYGLQNCFDNFQEAKYHNQENIKTMVKAGSSQKVEYTTDFSSEFRYSLKIQNVTFRYKNTNEDVLKNLSLEIKKGESIALVGASGAGKTTLADVIMGLLPPKSGQIMIDNDDISLFPNAWHKLIGYVPQSVFLIDDTIRANIAFGLPEEMVSDEKVWDAVSQAQLAEFIRQLPDGLNTIVGERGIKFSGGQRQRIALARALYANPEILVLDEATSALDNETEAAVMESIERLQGLKTLIIIAHRITTIRNCDKIFKIEDGLAKPVTYEELVKK